MHDIVHPDLAARFESHLDDPGHREAVLVTLDRPTGRGALVAAGMEVAMVSSEATIASGTIDRGSLARLTRLKGVIRVEADTEMRALGT